MRVLVCGGRNFGYVFKGGRQVMDYNIFNQAIDKVKEFSPSFIIQGGAKGGDEVGKETALVLDIPQQQFDADWDTHGKAAGFIRNQRMLDEGKPDLVIAFPGGNGTADMVRKSRKAGVKVVEMGE